MSYQDGGSGGPLDPDNVPTEAQPVHQWLQADGARWQARVPSHDPLDQHARMLSELPPDPIEPGASAQPSWPAGGASTPPTSRGPLLTVLAATSAVVIVALFVALLVNLANGRKSISPAENTPTAIASATASPSPSPSPSVTPSPSLSPSPSAGGSPTVQTGPGGTTTYFGATTPGGVIWQYSGGGSAVSSAAAFSDGIYIGGTRSALYAVDGATGKPLWSDAIQVNLQMSLVMGPSLVYVTTDDAAISAYRISDGALVWHQKLSNASLGIPFVDAGTNLLYVGGNSLSNVNSPGMFFALDANSGAVRWSLPLSGTASTGLLTLAPVADAGTAFITTTNGDVTKDTLHAIGLSSHKESWSVPVRGRDLFLGPGMVIVSSIGGVPGDTSADVTAYSLSDGRQLWTFPIADAGSNGLTAPHGGMNTLPLFVGTSNGVLYALDYSTGKQLWSANTGTPVLAPPGAWNGTVFVRLDNGVLQAYDANTGALKWHFDQANGQFANPPVPAAFAVSGPGTADNLVYVDGKNALYAVHT